MPAFNYACIRVDTNEYWVEMCRTFNTQKGKCAGLTGGQGTECPNNTCSATGLPRVHLCQRCLGQHPACFCTTPGFDIPECTAQHRYGESGIPPEQKPPKNAYRPGRDNTEPSSESEDQ